MSEQKDLVPMREQVYRDPRPKEHFDRFHERVRRNQRAEMGLRGRAGDDVAVLLHLPAGAGDLGGERTGPRCGDPRAEPLLLHGPLPDGLLPAAEDPLHGQVADVHDAAADGLRGAAARSRCAGAPATRRPSSPPRRSSGGGGDGGDVLRRRALTDGPSSPTRPSRTSGAWRWRAARRSSRSLSTAPQRVRNWRPAAVPQGDRAVRGAAAVGGPRRVPRASSSRPWPTRSRVRSSACTEDSSSTGAREILRRIREQARGGASPTTAPTSAR